MSVYDVTMRPLMAAAKHVKSIRKADFASSLLRLFDFKIPRVFGIALSGGVDSMCLAYLSAAFARKHGTKIFAFTVDHKLRDDSSAEAKSISNVLTTQLGDPDAHIRHEVLELDWKYADKSPHVIERTARTLRYRALAKACVKHRIEHLLLAHNLDDQIETVIMRLLRGSTSRGMAGMRRVSWIPEGHSTYGGHHVKILRPLLLQPKVRLIATCLGAQLPWFEDMTNHDPTYTKRNAVRYLLSQPEKLPLALRPQNLAPLCERLSDKRRQADSAGLRLFMQEMDKGNIRFSKPAMTVVWKMRSETYEGMNINSLASFIQRLVNMVTPLDLSDISSRRYREVVTKLLNRTETTFTFMNIQWTHSTKAVTRSRRVRPAYLNAQHNGENLTASPFGAHKLQSDKLAKKSRFSLIVNRPNAKEEKQEVVVEHYWTLARQRIPAFNQPAVVMMVPPSGWSDWKLWDGRMWIRLRWEDKKDGAAPKPVVIRPFSDMDRNTISKFGPAVERTFLAKTRVIHGLEVSTLPVLHDPELARMIAMPNLKFYIGPRELLCETIPKNQDILTDRR
ncbi:PP-loop family-domain-containing protein [Lipomyces tetrasporus]|uniref:tRNA(Ile)-lysidine synthetase n=1 Tax=Lipomyces tetrasporus TaxID=54092 RepID=A0AAD7QXX4_9ASCO|nr:PP-loop family-domain-containing protein [Lipomyces tetrasporus]KAJ8103474.1 PP-loop family-domain-containing protein [Lipomyces tetrasporus]